MGKMIPELSVSDIERSLKFYETFGFVKTATGVVDEKGSQWYALQSGDSDLWLLRDDIDPGFQKGAPRGNGLYLYLSVEDADAMYAKAQGGDLKIVKEIETMYYGLREFTVADPDGYQLVINTQVGQPQEASTEGAVGGS